MRAYTAMTATSPPPAAAPLTPDAAAVLSRAAADASRRRHVHTTPLHAAAALLAGPAPLLRDACAAGLASPHPLRCRALDLCFAVALDRLPSFTSEHQQHHDHISHTAAPPPLSNALAAALKRAYAHHRRIGNGSIEADDHCVGVPHLVLAILDDPSVARVMREASFSSTAVKAAMLRSISDPSPADTGVYVSPQVLHRRVHSECHREEEVRKVVEVLKRGKKRNPVLVGDTVDVDAVVQEVVMMIQRRRLGEARVIAFAKEFGDLVGLERGELVAKINELGRVIEEELSSSATANASVVINLGDLQWLVESRCGVLGEQAKQREVVLDTARAAVAEMARILKRSGDGEHRVWLIGTATCATYLKCQVYHPSLEGEWDLQAVPVAPRPSLSPPALSLGLSPRPGACRGILSSSVEVLSSAMTTTQRPSLCNACSESYERELAEIASETKLHASEQPMSQWLQIATPSSARFDRTQEKAREVDELRRRWRDKCAQLHSNARPMVVTCSEWNSTSAPGNRQTLQPRPVAVPSGTVETDLVLGTSRPACNIDDKMLVKRLTETVRWQPEAAFAVAGTVMKVKSGEGKPRGIGAKVDTWLLFAGPDVVGKRNMAEALSKSVFGTGAVTVRLGCPTTDDDGGESNMACRGRTALDRVAEAVRANPFCVIVLDGIDHSEKVLHGSIIRAIETGRFTDSHGREVGLGSVVFVIMSHWLPDYLKSSQEHLASHEHKILEHSDNASCQLELLVQRKTAKRRPEQSLDGDRHKEARKDSTCEGFPLDLNLSMCVDHAGNDDADTGEGSRNSSSDLTVEHEHEYGQVGTTKCFVSSSVSELIDAVDGTIVFKPVDFEPLKRIISDTISAKFGEIIGDARLVHVEENVLDRMAGAVWLSRTSAASFEAWADEVLCPSIRQLKSSLCAEDGGATVQLSVVRGHDRRKGSAEGSNMLPTSVTIAVDGD